MSEILRIGMVGCGGIAGAHVRGYKALWDNQMRQFEIAATCDIDKAKAEKMAADIATWQGKKPNVYGGLEEFLAKEKGIQAVDICSLHRNHHTLAIPCMQAGLHVTIEKPLAITMRPARMMLDAAKKTKRILHVAENYRRTPQNRAIHWALRQGRIGKPRMIYWVDVGERLWYWTWREHRDQAGGGWTLDGGVHFADLFRYHVGEVREIFSSVRTFFPTRYKKPQTLEEPVKVDVEDMTVSVLQFENGVTGQWTSTTAAPGQGFSKRVIYGEEGSLDFSAGLKTRKQELKVEELVYEFMHAISNEEKERLFPRGVTDSIATELKEFMDAVLHGKPMETSGADQYKSLAVCFGVYESAATNQPVKIKDIEDLKIEVYQRDLNEGLGVVKMRKKPRARR